MGNELLEMDSGQTTPKTTNSMVDNALIDENYEDLCKTDLIELLKEKRMQCASFEDMKHTFEYQLEQLERALSEQSLKCKHLEEDRSFLRNNIKKASENWFERKAKLSESDNEHNEQDGADEGEPRSHILITEEAVKLFSELKYKDEQLELSEMKCGELTKRLKDYEKVIDDQEVIIHGLENQLDTYFNDNQKMSKQLADLNKLFGDLEKANEKQVKPPEPMEEEESLAEQMPSEQDFKEMSKSVSKTYTKLKELIYEKKSLVTEIERLKTLNVELQYRVSQQETRLISVSDALQNTWLLVSNLKDEHAKLHTAETILRYELREKREILRRLREELECSREQWHIIRQKNSETEQEWTILREEINARRKAEQFGERDLTPEEVEGAMGGFARVEEKEFEPPIDLLVDMGIEYGVISADSDEPTTVLSLIGGEDVHADRLQSLEEQCSFLYQKLMSSTARALNLASRLTDLHQHYALSDDEGEEEDEEEDMDDEDEDDNVYDVEAISPDSEGYDTAYVSEVDLADSGSTTGIPADVPSPTANENATILEDIENVPTEDLLDDNCDILSRRLITFLPKKIEILKVENKRLEERLSTLQEEKNKMEVSMNTTIDIERRQRRQLEQQLTHLGKCVDELKLERNGKIAEVEEELRRKVAEVRKEEEEFHQLKDQLESLQEKFEQRELLLQLSSEQLQQTELRATAAENEVKVSKEELLHLREIISINKTNERCLVTQISQECQTNLPGILDCPEAAQAALTDSLSIPENLKTLNGITPSVSLLCQGNTPIRDEVKYDHLPLHISEAQVERLTIMTNAALRLPFLLNVGSSLCWTLGVHTEEIALSIFYDQKLTGAENVENHSLTPSFQIACSGGSNPVFSKQLVEPCTIRASNTLIKGTLTPRVPGQYTVVLANQTRRCQEVSLKFWLSPTT